MPASIFNGDAVKILKDKLKFKDGTEITSTEAGYLAGTTSDIQTQLDAKIPASEKGANNGVAELDGTGKVPASQLTLNALQYQGTFDPGTATFTDGGSSTGDFYIATAAGSYDAGSGSITYAIGDWAIHNGTVFEKSVNSDAVASVNGQTGTVVLQLDDLSLDNDTFMTARNAADDGNVNLLKVDSSDRQVLGDATAQVRIEASGEIRMPSEVSLAGGFGGGQVNIARVSAAGRIHFGNGSAAMRSEGNFEPSGDGNRSLGNVNLRWLNVHTDALEGLGGLTIESQTTPSGASSVAGIQSAKLVDTGMWTGNNSDNDAVKTQDVYLETGNKTDGTGRSGNVYLQPGTSAGSEKGSIILGGNFMQVSNRASEPSVGLLNGAMYFNTALDKLALYDSSNFRNLAYELESVTISSDTTVSDMAVNLVDTSAARSLTMPDPATSSMVVIKDASFNSETNNITMNPNSGEDIEGASTDVIDSDGASVVYHSNGTDWYRV